MNCTIAQRRLLSLERPDQPPEDVRGHLAWCSECRDWQKQLLRMERHVSRIPAPRCRQEKKDAFLASFLATNPAAPPNFAPTNPAPAPLRIAGNDHAAKQRRWASRLAAAAFLSLGWLMDR